MADTDEALIAAHRSGESAAFAELVRRHADSLLGYLLRLVGDRHEAEDLFQETFRRVHEKAGTFKAHSRFKS